MDRVFFHQGTLVVPSFNRIWRLAGPDKGFKCEALDPSRGYWRRGVPKFSLVDPSHRVRRRSLREMTRRDQLHEDEITALEAYADSIPKSLRKLVAHYGSSQFLALEAIAHVPGAQDFLAGEITGAGPGFVLASWILYDAHLRPQRDRVTLFKSMMTEKRSSLLSAITDREIDDRFVRLLNKITPVTDLGSYILEQLFHVHRDPDRLKCFMAAPNFSPDSLELAKKLPGWLLTPRLVNLLGDMKDGKKSRIIRELLDHLEWTPVEKRKSIRQSLSTVKDTKGLLRSLQKWLEILNRLHPLPDPPIPGNERLQPLRSGDALILEGLEMKNCVGKNRDQVKAGKIYYYRWLGKERATVSLVRSRHGTWQLDQCLGRGNMIVAKRTLRAVNDLIAQQLPTPSPITEGVIVGTRHYEAGQYWESLTLGDPLELRREPDNPHDANAVAIHNQTGAKLGYVPREQAVEVAEQLDSGIDLAAIVIGPPTSKHDIHFIIRPNHGRSRRSLTWDDTSLPEPQLCLSSFPDGEHGL